MDESNLSQQSKATPQHNTSSLKFMLVPFIGIVVVLIAVWYLAAKNNGVFPWPLGIQNTNVPIKSSVPTTFVHVQYLHEPTFQKSVATSFAKASEYSVKGRLPSAEELVQSSKLSFIQPVYAGGQVMLPVYTVNRHEISKSDALQLAQQFGLSGEPKRDGFTPPGYYAFIWDSTQEHFEVTGGSGTGGFEYYRKTPESSGTVPSDDEVKRIATEYLQGKGIIDNSYIISGIHGNVSNISNRTGFREDHKQVYFRRKINGYQAYNWTIGGGSPIVDVLEVWVGRNGNVMYATNNSFWSKIDPDRKSEYTIKEPAQVFEDVKAGRGKLAWLDLDAIGVSTGGYGPSAPDGNFARYGTLKNVVIEEVKLAYYHEPRSIDEPEYYQPIYIFTAHATLDWKDSYKVDYEADKFIQGKRTTVVLVAPAVDTRYFFENPVTVTQNAPVITSPPSLSTYYPTSTPPIPTRGASTVTAVPEKQTFILKLGTVTAENELKRKVYLSWEEVPTSAKYNVYLKLPGDTEYHQAEVGTGAVSQELTVNRYIDYIFKVQACTPSKCIDSNEVFLSQEQKPTFYLKLGQVTKQDEPKIEVNLGWSEVPGTVKYNVFLKNEPGQDYGAAFVGISELSYVAIVNGSQDNYFIVQACNNDSCIPSNEVVLPKQ